VLTDQGRTVLTLAAMLANGNNRLVVVAGI
jgi:hypothetical protein